MQRRSHSHRTARRAADPTRDAKCIGIIMAYQKALVCFANSVKTGGFCVAGKEIGSDAPGRWIRPVSGRPKGEVAANEYIYADNGIPHLLDIIEVGFSVPNPHAHQTENHIIDGTRWRKTGILAYA